MRHVPLVFEDVVALIAEWQEHGRLGFSLPVIRGQLLEDLEEFADIYRRENCEKCHGLGKWFSAYESETISCPFCLPHDQMTK